MNNELNIYLKNLKGKIYKILPLYETQDILVVKVYHNATLLNLSSADRIFEGILIEILVKLNEIDFDNMEHIKIRKIILESISMVDKMLKVKEVGDINGNIS